MSTTPNWDKVTLSMTTLLTDDTPQHTSLWFVVITCRETGKSCRTQLVLPKKERPNIIDTLRVITEEAFSADSQARLDASVKLHELFTGTGVKFAELEEALAA